MSADPILADFNHLKAACQELSQKKILVGIVGDVDSEVLIIAHAHEYGGGSCRSGRLFEPALMLTKRF